MLDLLALTSLDSLVEVARRRYSYYRSASVLCPSVLLSSPFYTVIEGDLAF